jgi:spore coat polysaccharide biosynthesis protein SpsF (cytidylyltransferase family)
MLGLARSRVVVVQARMGSTRLPGKVLERVGSVPLLAFLLRRLAPLKPECDLVVATSDLSRDEAIVEVAEAEGVSVSRGSESDVLDRFVRAAAPLSPEVVVRLTADNPCVDAALVKRALGVWEAAPPTPYLLTHEGGYPHGLTVEVVSWKALNEAWQSARQPEDREHVTKWIRERPERWPHVAPRAPFATRGISLTVDTADDLQMLRSLDNRAGGKLITLGHAEIISLAARAN